MRTYARINNGIVAELLATDGDITGMFHSALVWVDISSQVGVKEGWQFDGTNFTAPSTHQNIAQPPSLAQLQAQLAILSAQIAALSDLS